MRKTATNAFYLAVFALFNDYHFAGTSAQATYPTNPDVCALQPDSKVSDACASYTDLDNLNTVLHPYVHSLATKTDFFSYYRLNLFNSECPFWSDESGLCGNIACAVTTLEDENDIPAIWRAEELSRLEGPKAHHPGSKQQRERARPLMGELGDDVGESCIVEYDDECDERDYCVPEDESTSAKGDYVSLVDNPERFTGYAGEGAHQVWEAIYRENCFAKPRNGEQPSSAPDLSSSQNQVQAAQDLRLVMKEHGRIQAQQSGLPEDPLEFEDECLEKRVFYRVISGMHAAISTHLCHDYLNQSTGEWGPNLQCYKERLHDHPERISNLYFNYAFVLRAVGKLRDYVQDYTFCTGDPIEDTKTKKMITTLAAAIPPGPKIFDESIMFQDKYTDPVLGGISLKEDFRNRFRNVSRMMDCVGCDKCRLWGKVQTAGFGTALKVLFEFGDEDTSKPKATMRRTELVALINTLDKISSAMKAIEEFRTMIADEQSGLDAAESMHQVQSQRTATSDFADLDDLEEYDEDDDQVAVTLTDEFWEEFGLVWHAFVWVMQSWFSFPSKAYVILLVEVSRVWDWWLGLPMRERSWELRFPTRDEL